jgi:hypothetical protein
MTQQPAAPPSEIHGISDTMTDVYEAVATLEYTGRGPSRDALLTATRLPPDVLDDALAGLTGAGLLTTTGDSTSGSVYVPSRRGWSAKPDQAEGQKLGPRKH